MNWRNAAACFSLAAGICPAAMADDVVHRLSEVRFETPQWHFQPVHNPETGLVDAIVAIAKPDAAIGDNLNTVMFLRDGNHFEAWSWRNATRARAVCSAKMILHVPDEDDWRWMLDEPLPWLDDNALRPPVPYDAGLLTDDPLFEPVMASDDPQALVDFLASIGYAATSLRVGDGGGEMPAPDPDDHCEIRLLSLAGATEWGLTQPLFDEDLAETNSLAISSMLENTCGGCTPDEPTGKPDALVSTMTCSFAYAGDDYDAVNHEHHCKYVARKNFENTRTRELYANANCDKKNCVSTQTGFVSDAVPIVCGVSTSPCSTASSPSVCGKDASLEQFCATNATPPNEGIGKWSRYLPPCGDVP